MISARVWYKGCIVYMQILSQPEDLRGVKKIHEYGVLTLSSQFYPVLSLNEVGIRGSNVFLDDNIAFHIFGSPSAAEAYYHSVVNLISDYNTYCRFNEKGAPLEAPSVKIIGDAKILQLKIIRDENVVIARLLNRASQFRCMPPNSTTGLIVCTEDMEMYEDAHFYLSKYGIAIPSADSDVSSGMLELESAEAAQEYIEKLEYLVNCLCKDNVTASDSTLLSYDDCTVIN